MLQRAFDDKREKEIMKKMAELKDLLTSEDQKKTLLKALDELKKKVKDGEVGAIIGVVIRPLTTGHDILIAGGCGIGPIEMLGGCALLNEALIRLNNNMKKDVSKKGERGRLLDHLKDLFEGKE